MSELAFETAGNLARMIREREVSSVELLELSLARIERFEPAVHAVVTLDAERARPDAQRADAALARGDACGPLHGVPITIKDAFEVAGVRTTSGAKIWRDHVPSEDAVAVQRLRAAGAIIVGKTNVSAFCADIQTYNPLFGTTNNPWDGARTPGGSSGGASAALAAGLTSIELGSDIGGSIRTPAHWSGVCGHKSSFGLISQRGHLPPRPGVLSDTDLNAVGPLARSPSDLALLLSILTQPPLAAAHALQLHLPAPRASTLSKYRVLTWFDDADFAIDRGLRTLLERLADELRANGAEVSSYAPTDGLRPIYRLYRSLLDPISAADLSPGAMALLRASAAGSDGDDPLVQFARNALLGHREWIALDRERSVLRQTFARLFERADVLLCPVNLVPAIHHDHSPIPAQRYIRVDGQTRAYLDLMAWISPATLCYLPATVIPIGLCEGLPVGVQIIGPYFEDMTPIDFAARLEALGYGFRRPPGF